MKVFLFALFRFALLIGVASLIYFVLGWQRYGLLGAIGAGVIGAIVAFAISYLLFDRQRRAAATQFGEGVQRRRTSSDHRSRREREDNDIEDAADDAARSDAEGRGSAMADDASKGDARGLRSADRASIDAGADADDEA